MMLKPKVIFPNQPRLESPYQLEDCQRRLRDLRRREVRFDRLDDDRISFCIRRVKSVEFPMVAYEIHGTLRRWGGTGTILDSYRLNRLTVRVDTWVALFVTASLVLSVLLMLPTILHGADSLSMILGVLALMLLLGLLPLMQWIRHTRALDIEREIDATHQTILLALGIEVDE